MNINFNKTLFNKKSIKDNNTNISANKEGTNLNKLDLLDYASLKKLHGFQPDIELHEYKYSNDAILISELQKSIGETKKLKLAEILSKDSDSKSSSINNNSKNLENINFHKRNNETIIRCLKQYQNFIKYMKFHNVSIDLLEKICPFLMHKNIPKDSLLFKENTKANIFFGVINGKIGLRTYNPNIILENKRKYENEDINMEKIYIFKKKKSTQKNDIIPNLNDSNDNNNNDKIINSKEKEETNQIDILDNNISKKYDINYENIPGINKLLKEGYDTKILKKGECYGIYNLLYNQAYDVNGFALENTDIFYLEKEYFDKYLLTPISRIDLERKYLINKLIPSIPMELILNLRPEIYDNNHIIYTEFDYAFECFYIYKGSAELKKYSSAKTKNDIYEHKNILKTISKIDERGIAGLEICKGPNSFYDNTLIITDPNTIIYRINILKLKGKKHTAQNNIKKFFSKLYEQQKIFLQKTEEKNKEYEEIYKINLKKEKPKFNYSNFFNNIFKDVNPPVKMKKNKLPQYQLKKMNLEIVNNSNQKIKNIANTIHNKTLFNSRYKTIDTHKRYRNSLFTIYNNKNKKKYIINSKQISRNEEDNDNQNYNSINIYNSLSSSSKIKSQKHMIKISQDSKFNSINSSKNTNIKAFLLGKEAQKSENISFPKLIKNNSTKNKKNILFNKIGDKFINLKSADKCLYDSGEFQIPFVSLTDNNSKNMKKIRNLARYAQLKKLILNKKFLC